MPVPPNVPKRTTKATLSKKAQAEKELNARMAQIDNIIKIADEDAWKLTVRDVSNATGLSLATTYRTMKYMGLLDDNPQPAPVQYTPTE